ncbi:alpha/beta hydrolase [Pseudonocardia endophytica]|uniref:Acetyl esterase/lipase n=1 Tax=Pseudonocardia endophytica TaxID=401976 RepID=A0A4R1HM32_PSEEN|nr:alpha/beta hydrolase [Pseudonocardia endophytica]TCK22171.1 acetyl esterase/lipase [Pseudonocardia endophytica]
MSTYALDAELRAAAAALPRIDRTDVARARRITASPSPPAPPDDVTVSDHTVRAADGHDVRLRMYRPDRATGDGAVYHVHGGGFVLGGLGSDHLRTVEIARETGAAVVSVGYRLAPEWPFPAPVDDVYTGLTGLPDLDIDPARVVLHGVSAGGGLAAAAALMARDRGTPPVRGLVLVSPMLDDRLATASSLRFTDTPALTRRDLQICWSAYLGALAPGSAEVPAYAAPARALDLRGLPRTYVAAAELDPLRDEAVAFAQSLLGAGVPVELHLFPGTYHGSVLVRGAAVSERQTAEEGVVLRTMLGPEGDR